ncbi:MAG: tetratricopeptide repeat protein [Nitrospirae bacterium]|nr:tetratricopeptide repeat protein [Nitrospirota bacterium]
MKRDEEKNSKKVKKPKVHKDRDKAQKHILKGDRFAREKNYDKAIESYKKSLEYDPRCSSTYQGIGLLYEIKQNTDEAIDNYIMATSINPNLDKAHFRLGLLYYRKNEFKNAIKYFSKALKKGYSVSESHFWRAKSYEGMGDGNNAIADYKIAEAHGDREAKQILLSRTVENLVAETEVKNHTAGDLTPKESIIALPECTTGGLENRDDGYTEVGDQATQHYLNGAHVRNFNEDAKVKYIAIDKLTPRKPMIRHSDVDRIAIALSVEEKGILDPFTVIKNKTGSYEILNGSARYWIARDKKIKEVPCIIIENMNEDEKQEYIVTEMLAHRHLNVAQKALLAIRYVLPKEVELALKRRNESRKVRVAKESVMATQGSQHAGADLALTSTVTAQRGKATDITAERCAMPRDVLRQAYRIYKEDQDMLEKAANENIPISEMHKKMFGDKPKSMSEQQASEDIDGHIDMQAESTPILEQAPMKCNLRIDRGNPDDVAPILLQAADANVSVGGDIQNVSPPLFTDVSNKNAREDSETQNKPAPILSTEENKNTTFNEETPLQILNEIALNASDRKDPDKRACVGDIQGRKISTCIKKAKESYQILMGEAIKVEESASMQQATRIGIISSLTEFKEYTRAGVEKLEILIERLTQPEKKIRTA